MDEEAIVQLERRSMKGYATRLHVYFFFTLAMLSGVLFFAGLLGVLRPSFDFETRIPDELLLLCVGFVTFALFFPSFLILYVARHLLASVESLEQRLSKLVPLMEKMETSLAKE